MKKETIPTNQIDLVFENPEINIAHELINNLNKEFHYAGILPSDVMDDGKGGYIVKGEPMTLAELRQYAIEQHNLWKPEKDDYVRGHGN